MTQHTIQPLPTNPTSNAAIETVANERLYPLLPAIYRIRDSAVGEPLRALLAALEQELNVLEGDIDALYDDWFIETCAEWVVPYIGDLLGVQDLYAANSAAYGQQERRAYIANTLSYRRRKGTTPILEQLARDVSGWQARVVEFGKLVETTQHLDHLRPGSTTVNLRANNQLQEIGTPFEQQAAYSVEVRSPQQGGRYGLSHIGLFIWRLQSYPMTRSMARAVAGPEPCVTGRYYTFSPLGKADMPLFNQPQTETDISTLAQEINVPAVLRRPVLAAELLARRQAFVAGKSLSGIRYFDSDPVFQIFVDGQPTPLPPEDILIARLDRDRTDKDPISEKSPWLKPDDIVAIMSSVSRDDPALLTKVVAVDPELGRLVFFSERTPQRVEVSYAYGFSEDVGGGPYGRALAGEQTLPEIVLSDELTLPQPIDPLRWHIQQTATADPEPLATAVHFWNQTIMAWQGLKDETHFPLGKVTISPVQVAQIGEKAIPFAPGIAEDGLRVRFGLCENEIVVREGVAIDRQGRRLALPVAKSFDFTRLGLDKMPNCTGVLVLAYQNEAIPQINLLSVAQLETLPVGLVIPLAKLTVDAANQQLTGLDLSVRIPLRPGIVQGLSVGKRPGTLEAWITAGNGVNARGEQLILGANQGIDLRPHQGERRAILLVQQQGEWTIQLLPLDDYKSLAVPFIYLASLDIPFVTVEINDPLRPLPPWTVEGLAVASLPNSSQIKLSSGSIKRNNKILIELKADTILDLSAYAGRSLTVFVSLRSGQGLPLPDLADEACFVGVVPVEPMGPQARMGQIVIGDNGTYSGDLRILMTPDRHLQVVAAAGYRPHILGDVGVWAIAPDNDDSFDPDSPHLQGSHRPIPGELTLNGLLIEGAVQLLPGNLRRLSLAHCTLAPTKGGLQVIAPEPVVPSEEPDTETEEDISLIAVLMYGIAILWQLISQDLGLSCRSSSLTFTRTMQLFTARLLAWVATLERVCEGNQTDWAWESRQDHADLEISLERTITGTIALAKAVPHLRLMDCVVDSGQVGTSAMAIAAPGTALYALTSTVLGRVKVRSLSTSDCLFSEKVIVQQRQTGCVRFSYVPIASRTPRRYQCQPDRALAESLTTIPGGISTLLVQSTLAQFPLVLCGTSGDGLFQFGVNSPAPNKMQWLNHSQWQDRSGNLSDRHITALAAITRRYPHENLPAAPEDSALDTLIVGSANGEIFHTPIAGNLRAEDWRTVPFPVMNTAISGLWPIRQRGLGKVTVTGNQVKGEGTDFVHELQVGDLFSLDNQAIHRVARIDSNTELTLTNNHDLDIDQPSAYAVHSFWVTTAGSGVWRIPLEAAATGEWQPEDEVALAQWQPVNEGLTDKVVTALTQTDDGQLWVGTASEGVFRLSRHSQEGAVRAVWVAENTGLCSKRVRSLIVDTQQQLVVGTAAGVFRREADSDCWQGSDLNHSEVSALVAYRSPIVDISDRDHLLIAGTTDGKTFRSIDGGETWTALSLDVRGTDITALAVASQKAQDGSTDSIEIWAATAAGDVLFSEDDGDFWQSRHQSLPHMADKLRILQRLQPLFTATDYGAPGYGQLAESCALALRTGAEDGAEMGVFNSLKQPQREANLRASIDEYLRFGLTAGIFYMT
ncbi:MAG: two-component regulator propeller domain-containing protein [Phormidesmis sp.]